VVVKKTNSFINVAFKDLSFTNKLYAQNIQLINNQTGSILSIDYSHYSKQKRKNLEDSDFEKLVEQKAEIASFLVSDRTVQLAISEIKVVQVIVNLSDGESVSVPVTSYDKASGILK